MTNRTEISPVRGWHSRGGFFLLPACIPGGWKWEWMEGRRCQLRERTEDILGVQESLFVLPEGGRCRFLPLLITNCPSSFTGQLQECLECPQCHSLSLGAAGSSAKPVLRWPPRHPEQEMLIRSGVNSQAKLQAGTGAAPEDAGPRGSCRIAPLPLGMFLQVTEPRSARPGLGLPRSSLLITGPIFR